VRVEPREQQGELDTCALHGDTLSAWSRWMLHMLEVEDRYEDDPRGALAILHESALEEVHGPGLFVLAELSYSAAKRLDDRGCYFAAAVYAYLYLLPSDPRDTPSAYDRHFRWACDIYNDSLRMALRDPKKSVVTLDAGRREMPIGALQVEVDYAGFPFPTEQLELLPADERNVVGLSIRVRDSGLGVPVIAVARQRGEGTAGVGILDKTSVAATAFLRLRGGLEDIRGGIPAVLELHSAFDTTSIEIAGRTVPLESDVSAAVAYEVQSADLWRFNLSGLFQGEDAEKHNGLILPRPFQHGRIPVVLVHGTASNPAYWAELMNALTVDPVIRARYQFWFFIYSSGNPIVYSAATLRRALTDVLAKYDPDGNDAALRRMVVVGHSQGGLLTKLMGVTVDTDAACREVLGSPLAELKLEPAQEQLLRECFDVQPMPCVERLVFVATPHHGSFLAAKWYSKLFAGLIAVPGEFGSLVTQMSGSVSREKLPTGMEDRVPTSLDNMDPSNKVLLYLAGIPVDPRIHTHSIIPIGDADPAHPDDADDGVVKYASAHLEGVESQIVVPSGHSCQSHPRTLIELRRILIEHLGTPSSP
jgi:pimeloyl-ACP methyl ester carboxylesterase